MGGLMCSLMRNCSWEEIGAFFLIIGGALVPLTQFVSYVLTGIVLNDEKFSKFARKYMAHVLTLSLDFLCI